MARRRKTGGLPGHDGGRDHAQHTTRIIDALRPAVMRLS